MPGASSVNRKEGELLKYKNVLSGWGKRYFRLERSYLHYFETKHTHKPIATITRGEISEVKVSSTCPGKENVFEIVQRSGIVWYCQAQSAEEMVGWMQALSTVPIVLDPSQYPMVPAEAAPPPVNPNFVNVAQPAVTVPITPSPYAHLIEQAHHTAETCNTPHICRHVSPPPPYSAGNRPPFISPHQQPPPRYSTETPGHIPYPR